MTNIRRKQQNVRWALVGLGRQAERMAAAIRNAPHNELVAVVGKDLKRNTSFLETYPAPHSFASLQALLSTDKKQNLVDAVCITSPNDEHTQQCLLSLRAGKNVLCEKPLALSVSDGRAIERAAKKYKALCNVDFQLRLHPAILDARKLIAEKKLGTLVCIEMQWSIGTFGETKLPPLPKHMAWREEQRRSGGGAIMARGAHLFDLARFLTGKEVSSVHGLSDASPRSVDRTIVGVLRLDTDILVTIVTSKRIPAAHNRIVIYGSDARLTLTTFDAGGSLELLDATCAAVTHYPSDDLYASVFEDFYKARRGESFVGATALDGVRAIEITESFIASAKKASRNSNSRAHKSTSTHKRKPKKKV